MIEQILDKLLVHLSPEELAELEQELRSSKLSLGYVDVGNQQKDFVVNPMLLCDFYKISHRQLYPQGTTTIYSTWTPRMSRIQNVDKVVAFGFQSFIKDFLIGYFNKNFFKQDINGIVADYKRTISRTLDVENPDSSHIEALWNLGYLPIRIKAVKEGKRIAIRSPILTIENTVGEFFWLTNYLETVMSSYLWMPTTSATLSNQYRTLLNYWANKTVGNTDFVSFQGHDFSMRGMSGGEASMMSGAGHLLSFVGTDTIPAIYFLEHYYNADIDNELVGTSIPASEHSVASSSILGIEESLKTSGEWRGRKVADYLC